MRPLILQIDENPALPARVAGILEQDGYELLHTADPEHAIRLVEERCPVLVVMGIELSGCEGLHLMAGIRDAQGGSVPVLVVTDVPRDTAEHGEAIALGCLDFLTKPVGDAVLLAAIREVAPALHSNAPAEETAAADLSGDLSDTPMPELLARLRRRGANGVLSVDHAGVRVGVQLRNGSPVAVSSSRGESMAEALLYDTFRWEEGHFAFCEGRWLESDSTLELAGDPAGLLLAGVLDASPTGLVRDRLAKRESLYVSITEESESALIAEGVGFTDQQRTLLDSLGGEDTLSVLLESEAFEERLIYALWVGGWLDLRTAPTLALTELLGDLAEPELELPEPLPDHREIELEEIRRTRVEGERELAKLARARAEREQELEELARTRSVRMRELQELARAREDREREHDALGPALEERTQELEKLERARERRARELKALARMREKHEQELEELARAREERAREHEALAPALEEQAQELAELERARAERARELEALNRVREEYDEELEELSRAREEHARELEELAQAREERERQHDALAPALEKGTQELKKFERARERHARELKALARMREKHKRELEELACAREESARQHEALAPVVEERAQELAELERAREERARELEALARIREEHEQELTELARAREEHARDVESLARELDALVRIREEHEQELTELARARAEHAQELEELARARAQQAQELEQLTLVRSEREQELEALKHARAKHVQELEARTPSNAPVPELEQGDPVPAEPEPMHGELALVGEPPPPDDRRTAADVLRELAKRMLASDDFQILGVAATASDREVYSAFLKILREIPEIDSTAANLVLSQKAERIRGRIESAYANLRTEEKRRAYSLLREEEEQDRRAKPSAERALEGERWFRKGKAHLDQKRCTEAVEAFGMASHLDPEQGEYASHLGYALHLSNPNDPVVQREAMEHLACGIKRSPRDELAHVFLGRILKGKGDIDVAKKIFLKALRIKPNFHPAVQELRVLEMRERNSKGVLSRLIGR